jgi:hypothetical protein
MFDSPNVIVPEPVIGEPESTSIPSVPAIATEVTDPPDVPSSNHSVVDDL